MENQKEEQKAVLYPKDGEVTFLMPNTNSIGMLKKAKKGTKLTAKYMKVEDWEKLKGIEKLCYFLGFKGATDRKGNTYYIAKLHDGETPFVAAQTVLVQSLSNIPIGQGVSIVCTDVVSNANNGRTPLFEITKLNVNLMDNDL